MMTVLKKRSEEVKKKKEQKQYKQFMTDFCCQNASLSKALARHDRRTIKDDQAAEAQDKVRRLPFFFYLEKVVNLHNGSACLSLVFMLFCP